MQPIEKFHYYFFHSVCQSVRLEFSFLFSENFPSFYFFYASNLCSKTILFSVDLFFPQSTALYLCGLLAFPSYNAVLVLFGLKTWWRISLCLFCVSFCFRFHFLPFILVFWLLNFVKNIVVVLFRKNNGVSTKIGREP